MADEEPGVKLRDIVDEVGMARLQEVQNTTLSRILESKTMMKDFNDKSEERYLDIKDKLHNRAHVLGTLKDDLMHIYNQIRVLKKLVQQVEIPQEGTASNE